MAAVTAHATFALAGHGRRIAAALLDGVLGSVIVAAFGAAGFGIGLLGAGGTNSDGWDALGWVLVGTFLGIVLGAGIWIALIVWLVRRPGTRNGQTIGKQALGIRAARADRSEIGVGVALLREIVAKGVLIGVTSSVISGLLGFLDAGLIGGFVAVAIWYGPAFADEQRRGLHDRLSGTRVIVADSAAAPAAPSADDELWPAPA